MFHDFDHFFAAADQSRMMQEQMTMQAGGMQDPKQVKKIETLRPHSHETF